MRRVIHIWLFFLLLALHLGCSTRPEGSHTERSFIKHHSGRVSQERLMSSAQALVSIHSRYAHWDAGAAETLELLQEILAVQGTPAELDSFSFFRFRWIETANVEVFFEGRERPGRELLVGAHWDSVDWPESVADSSVRAPGADDNASGVAALLELARILKDLPLAHSVRLIFFAGEEVGLKGSFHASEYWRTPGARDSLICLFNVDQIGHDPDLPDASIVCNSLSVPLAAEALAGAQSVIGSHELAVQVDTLRDDQYAAGGSDHLPFWYNDLPAIWLQEGPEDRFAHANSEQDTFEVLCPAYLTECTQVLVGAVLRLAQPVLD